ncbi:hypothetical protein NDU88_002659 [Pleurodeles waltl]|uniref:Uncharacterized protein n=1 Tax=Pleurodeles waltl TaxID=8319 RepID=A0AAV7TMH0_PLEWA|nr:hypothetical protein NDU88_002659 [Pleurodeles waltl]
MPGRPFQRRRTEEPTGERTTGTGGENEEATAGGFRRYREEDGSEDPTTSRSRPLDKDCWPQRSRPGKGRQEREEKTKKPQREVSGVTEKKTVRRIRHPRNPNL